MVGENHCRSRRCVTVLFLFLLPVLLSGCGRSDLNFPTEYQAVFLDTGQVFFGRLSGDVDSPFLTFRDVFYVKQQTTPDKKETQNLLLKRGGEWHGPDSMHINSRHVVYIEPVAPDSRVAQLIREARKPAPMPPAAAPAPVAPAPAPSTPPVVAPKTNEKAPTHR